MAMPLHGRTWILLLAGMTAEMAAPPPDLTAQSGPGEPGRALGAWVEEARENPFHGPTRTGTPDTPIVAPGAGLGMADTHDMSWRPPPVADTAVSPGRVLAFTLAGAMIPLIPAAIYNGLWEWGNRTADLEGKALASLYVGGLATLVTVPVAIVAAGVDSLPRTLAGTVIGLKIGAVAAALISRRLEGVWIPVFSVTWASVATLITTG